MLTTGISAGLNSVTPASISLIGSCPEPPELFLLMLYVAVDVTGSLFHDILTAWKPRRSALLAGIVTPSLCNMTLSPFCLFGVTVLGVPSCRCNSSLKFCRMSAPSVIALLLDETTMSESAASKKHEAFPGV